MLVFLSACSAAVMASPFFSQSVRAVATNAAATIACVFIVVFLVVVFRTSLMNVLSVVLIVPFTVDCPPNNTVTVLAYTAAQSSLWPLGDLVEWWQKLDGRDGRRKGGVWKWPSAQGVAPYESRDVPGHVRWRGRVGFSVPARPYSKCELFVTKTARIRLVGRHLILM